MPTWWEERPMRLIQTNLRELDARRDPREIVREAAEFGANAILFSVGGIVSFYPTALPFQTPIPNLPGDFVGAAVEEAHRLGLRFIARLDLSKAHKHVYEAHPEWFYRRADGQPQMYNGLYSTCVAGGYYREYAGEIIAEIMARYPVDGFFFNMFGYQTRDYSGNYHGLCYCENCQRRYAEMFGRPLPKAEDLADPAYLDFVDFQRAVVDDVSARVAGWIHGIRPNVAFTTGLRAVKHVDIVRSETNTAVDRPLPIWPYGASENAMRTRGAYPLKPNSDAIVYFLDIPYRFAAVSEHLNAQRLAQALAHGGGLDLYVLGTLAQDDTSGFAASRALFAHAAQHEAVYHQLTSLARVALIAPDHSIARGKGSAESYRGMFRLLTEAHLPFDVLYDWKLEEAESWRGRYDLVILPGAACLSAAQAAALDRYVAAGGALLATGETSLYDERGRPRDDYALECLGARRVITKKEAMRSAYFRVQPAERQGPLADTGLLMLDGRYLYVEAKEGAGAAWTLVPPSLFGPPEKVWADQVESPWPGAIFGRYGRGRAAYLPWELDRLYYKHSSPGHAAAWAWLVDALLGGERQLVTDAHPLVELVLLARPDGNAVINLVNLSGHQGTAFHAPVPMRDLTIRAQLPGPAKGARALALDRELAVRQEGGYTVVTLPELGLFETIVFG